MTLLIRSVLLITETGCNMKSYLFLPVFVLLAGAAQAQASEVFATDDGAIRGYDPVAYFTESKPVKGKPEYKLEWKGKTWYFSSEKNLVVFKASPESFAPQYGGYCAWGMSRGYKATTDATAWTIINGKLYLNYSRGVQEEWSKQPQYYIQLGDKNWPNVKSKEK
jgi:YHS domain-containing protein